MAIPVQMPISLHDEMGVSNTRMLQVSDRLIEIEGETTRIPGQELEFQFAMVGFDRTLTGRAVVEKVVDPEYGRGRCTLRIVEIEASVLATFRTWLYELTQGGGRPLGSRPPDPTSHPRSTTPSQQRSSSSLASPSLGERPSTGRAAVRDTLSSYAARRAQAEQHARVSAAAKRKRKRVEIRVAAAAQPPLVMVRFNDPTPYTKHFWQHLHRDTLELRCPASGLAEGDDTRVRLVLPGGAVVDCSGRVTAASASAIAVSLVLVDSDRATMQLAAGPRPGGGASQARRR
jgi:hypothetical protein